MSVFLNAVELLQWLMAASLFALFVRVEARWIHQAVALDSRNCRTSDEMKALKLKALFRASGFAFGASGVDPAGTFVSTLRKSS